MNYADAFKRQHTLLIVVHAEEKGQVLRNVEIAHTSGADGVFLVNHSIPFWQLLDHYAEARMHYQDWWIGLNFLDLEAYQAMTHVPEDASGLWVDDIGIREHEKHPTVQADFVRRIHEDRCPQVLLFGGVAFKYQRHVEDVQFAARLAVPHVDVVTTSGDATGVPADPDKIRRMKLAIGENPLAVASGITVDNVAQYLEWANCFMVATGVSDSHTELNPTKVRDLVERIS